MLNPASCVTKELRNVWRSLRALDTTLEIPRWNVGTSGPGAVATRIEELELYVQDVQTAQQQIRRLPLYTQILRIQSSLATSILNGSWKLDLELPTTQNHPISD